MNRILSSSLLLLASLAYLSASCAQANSKVYKMPQTLVQKLKTETEQRQRGECEQQHLELFSDHFYALSDGKLLLLIGLPDYFCHSGSFMPVTIDNQGHWNTGAVIESLPTELLTDKARRLWLVSHWEIEGVFPFLHHSTDGSHWQEISLPKPQNIDCCFQYLKQVCVVEAQIQLKFTGIDDTPVEYWGTTVSDSLTSTPHWQKLAPQQLKNDKLCQINPLTNGDWQRTLTADGNEVRFQSAIQGITVIIPR